MPAVDPLRRLTVSPETGHARADPHSARDEMSPPDAAPAPPAPDRHDIRPAPWHRVRAADDRRANEHRLQLTWMRARGEIGRLRNLVTRLSTGYPRNIGLGRSNSASGSK